MPNTNAQTIHQMGQAINSVVRQATGRDAVGNIDMDFVTVAQNKSIRAITPTPGAMTSFFVPSPVVLAKLKAQITPTQTGSGDPSPENVRPIVGVNPLVVNITGINQWDEEWVEGYYSAVGSLIYASGYVASKNLIPILPNTVYTQVSLSGYTGRICYYDSNRNFLSTITSYASTADTAVQITTPANAYFMSFDMKSGYGGTYKNDMSINYPSTGTSYHAYTGRTQSISFSPTPGTVYGGELEVDEHGDGVLTVTWWAVDLGTLSWTDSASGQTGMRRKYTNLAQTEHPTKKYSNSNVANAKCTKYLFESANVAYSGTGRADNRCAIDIAGDLSVYDSSLNSLTTSEAIAEALSGVIVSYELKIPETYQISTTPVTTISGENNIFTGTGDVEVTYYEYGEVI